MPILLTVVSHMLSPREEAVHLPERRRGTNGAILTGSMVGTVDGAVGMAHGAAGTPDGVAGQDRSSGLTSSAISWRSRSGRTRILTPSGLTGIGLCGTLYSGRARTTGQPMPSDQTIMTFMANTHTATAA